VPPETGKQKTTERKQHKILSSPRWGNSMQIATALKPKLAAPGFRLIQKTAGFRQCARSGPGR